MIAVENATNNREKRNRDTTATEGICVTKTRKADVLYDSTSKKIRKIQHT
jgi:hypothetical protein